MLLTRLIYRISHFCKHKFKDSFQDILHLLFSCWKAISFSFSYVPITLTKGWPSLKKKKIRNINFNILEESNSRITLFFLHGDSDFTALTNFIILNSAIKYMLATNRFDILFFLEYFQFVLIWHSLFISLWSMILGTIFCWYIIFNTEFLPYFLTLTLFRMFNSIFLPVDCKFLRCFYMK